MLLFTPNGEQIDRLENQGCVADDWRRVWLEKSTDLNRIRGVHFSGGVRLGSFRETIERWPGVYEACGVFDSRLHDVQIGDNCLVRNSVVVRAILEPTCLVDSVRLLMADGETTFGEGSVIFAPRESGTAGLPLWRGMSSTLAHILAYYDEHPAAQTLRNLITQEIPLKNRCRIGIGAVLERISELRNVRIGDGAVLIDVAGLRDCSVESGAIIQNGVNASNCLFSRLSRVFNGVNLDHCFVGEGVRLSDGFHGEHSMFFANSDCRRGEAQSVLAGPHAVSHHKSSLLLACSSSHSNYGSAANASNHQYKLGPIHSGILDRGVKLGSGSYLRWPSRVGAFSIVAGVHKQSLDTRSFPFSLLVGDGESILVPAARVFSIGVLRDELNWKKRERRLDLADPLDLHTDDPHTPAVLQAAMRGRELLLAGEGATGCAIPSERRITAAGLYRSLVVYHAGATLLRWLDENVENVDAMIRKLSAPGGEEQGEWLDWGGLPLSGKEAGDFLCKLTVANLSSIAWVDERLRELSYWYKERRWLWLANWWRTTYTQPTRESLAVFWRDWLAAADLRMARLAKEAEKEYAAAHWLARDTYTGEEVHSPGWEGDESITYAREEHHCLTTMAQRALKACGE